MRLFMTTDAVGGVWTYAVDLARGLAAHGVATTLAVLGPRPDAAQRDQADAIGKLDLIETGLGLDWQAETIDQVAFTAEQVAELARQSRPDLVHLNSPSLAGLARLDVRTVGTCHSCVATWWAATRAGDLPGTLRWQQDVLRRGYACCDGLVAPSEAFADATSRMYGFRPRVVHNGRDAAPGENADRERCVLTAGRLWDCAKNLHTLDKVAGMIDAPVYAAGALQVGHGDTIRVSHLETLGHLANDALRGRMRRSAVFASLALYEPFGLTVLEAAQAGCALVLSDIESFRELWAGAAVFVPPMDAAGCARILTALLDDPGRAAALGEAARDRAGRYTLERMAAGMMDVYRGLLAGAGEAA